ncbi:hypothetical protein GQR58_002028 [Nymphon striatum]|nr:hypothetical protein GQR58_002028 [Nymphon striatum]
MYSKLHMGNSFDEIANTSEKMTNASVNPNPNQEAQEINSPIPLENDIRKTRYGRLIKKPSRYVATAYPTLIKIVFIDVSPGQSCTQIQLQKTRKHSVMQPALNTQTDSIRAKYYRYTTSGTCTGSSDTSAAEQLAVPFVIPPVDHDVAAAEGDMDAENCSDYDSEMDSCDFDSDNDEQHVDHLIGKMKERGDVDNGFRMSGKYGALTYTISMVWRQDELNENGFSRPTIAAASISRVQWSVTFQWSV